MTLFVGLTGTNCAGKGTFAQLACQHVSCQVFSLSDEVRAEATGRGLELTRENLIRVGNETRKALGPGVFAERTAKKALAAKGNRLVFIDSIRAVGEVKALRRILGKDFVLVAVDASPQIRFERALARKREGEQALSFDGFLAQEEKELRSQDAFGQSLLDCIAMADEKIGNFGSVEEFADKVKDFLKTRRVL